jgi:hypothetical protein
MTRTAARPRLAESGPSEALALSEVALPAHETSSPPITRWTKESARANADALDAVGPTDEAAALRARYGIRGAAT